MLAKMGAGLISVQLGHLIGLMTDLKSVAAAETKRPKLDPRLCMSVTINVMRLKWLYRGNARGLILETYCHFCGQPISPPAHIQCAAARSHGPLHNLHAMAAIALGALHRLL